MGLVSDPHELQRNLHHHRSALRNHQHRQPYPLLSHLGALRTLPSLRNSPWNHHPHSKGGDILCFYWRNPLKSEKCPRQEDLLHQEIGSHRRILLAELALDGLHRRELLPQLHAQRDHNIRRRNSPHLRVYPPLHDDRLSRISLSQSQPARGRQPSAYESIREVILTG